VNLIDREHVIEILSGTNAGFSDPLEALETEGYQVVRAGLVPRIDALDDAEQMLDRLGSIIGAIHDPRKARDAATQIRQLRELALLVLRIDRDDVDEAGS
jgi:hypothetical protein